MLGRRFVAVALAGALGLALSACGDGTTDPSDVSLIEWKSSFGFCPPAAYCITRVQVSGTDATLILESRQSPTQTSTSRITEAEAESLRRAAVQARFDELPPVIGCPDCADGGAETLTVTAKGQDTVTFEYGAEIAELEPLLTQMRSLVMRIHPPVR